MDARTYMMALVLILAAGCSSLDLQPRDAANPIWATEGATAMRGNAVSDRIEPPLEMAWDFDARAGFGLVSPLVIGDVVLVATRKGEVHAIDIGTGKRVGQADFGDSIEGTPIYEDGTLIVPLAWGGVALHAHDLRLGNRKWRVRGAPVSTGLVAHGGSVIAGDVEGYLRAYDIGSGSERWSRLLDERSGIHSTPVVSADRLVAANDRGHVAALDVSSGSLLWSADVEAPVQVSLAATGETVFVATTRGQLRALDLATGSVRWTFDLRGSSVYLTAPALGEGDIVFGASDGFVRSLDAEDGTLRWSTDVSAAVTAPPVLTDHLAYVGTMEGSLLALRRTDGSAVWEEELAGRMKSAFAVKDSRLIVLSEPRLVSLFQPRPEPYAIYDE